MILYRTQNDMSNLPILLYLPLIVYNIYINSPNIRIEMHAEIKIDIKTTTPSVFKVKESNIRMIDNPINP